MTDAGTITRRGGTPTTDPTTGVMTWTQTTVYTGKARIRPQSISEAQTQRAGEAADLLDEYLVSVPFSASGIRVDDIFTATASADPDLVGLSLRIIGVVRGTAVTARRLRCRVEADEGV